MVPRLVTPSVDYELSAPPHTGNDRLTDVIKSNKIQNIQKGTPRFQEAVFILKMSIKMKVNSEVCH
jgi:hypothetical protein